MLRVLVLLMLVSGLSFGSVDLVAEIDSCPEWAPIEICDNGIDDDGDGLIDLNDDDCDCHDSLDSLLVPSSLILNPSFEDTLCCPNHLAQLDCAKDWVQASSATSDYFNTCDFTTDRYRTVPPSPLPSGEGYVGFRDEKNYKEYVGTCLSDYMAAGTPYKLEFYVGFGKDGDFWKSTSPFKLSLFGSQDCSNLPFGGPGYVSCPLGLNDWFEIAQVSIKGEDEWVKVSIEFTVPVDVNAFVIGPSCSAPKGENFYYLDDLILAESAAFESSKLDVVGGVCDEVISLSGQKYRGVDYQWYHDGVAIAGATNRVYEIRDFKQGNYQLRISVMGQCFLSDTYTYTYENYAYREDTLICNDEIIEWEGKQISSRGTFTAEYEKADGCDSILTLVVDYLPKHHQSLDTSLCPGETIVIGGEVFDKTGTYDISMSNKYGCDSTVELNLNVLREYQTQIDTQLCQGDIIVIGQQVFEESGNYNINLFTVNGCDSTINLNLLINEASTSRIDTTMCKSDVIKIANRTFDKAGDYTILINNSKGCDSTISVHIDSYNEYHNIIDTMICSNDILELGTESWDEPGTYTIKDLTIQGCDSLTEIRLKMAEEIVPDLLVKKPISCNDEEDAVVEVVVSGGYGVITYKWSNGEEGSSISNVSSGIYSVSITDELGCEQSTQIEIINPDELYAEFISSNPTCDHPLGGKIELGVVEGGTPPYVMSINGEIMDDNTMKNHEFGPGEYEVALIDKHDCMVMEMISFEEPGLGEIDIITDKLIYVQGELVELDLDLLDINADVRGIQWYPKSAFECSTCENVETRMFQSKLDVSVELTDENGCVYTRSIALKANSEYFVPNVFTPNNDGINDLFEVFTDGSDVATILEFEIFDRWGNLVYSQYDFNVSDNSLFWDGTLRGKKITSFDLCISHLA